LWSAEDRGLHKLPILYEKFVCPYTIKGPIIYLKFCVHDIRAFS